jgi:uncharacterized membrane protein (UPF0127 family)
MPFFVNALGFAVVSFVMLACNRAPDEPSTRTGPDPLPAVTAAPSSTISLGGRCVVPLATVAPEVPQPAGKRCPPDPTGRFKLARARVTFPATGSTVDAELARTAAEDERGLMYRQEMREDEGMLFTIEDRKVQTFWMHNTCIPLDMLFIDEDGLLVGAVESAPVLDDGPRQVDCQSRYVLEVNAGWVRRHDVQPGQHVNIPK